MASRECKQCKRKLPDSDFWKPLNRSTKVHKCHDCVGENMGRWGRTSLKKFDPDKVSATDE